MKYSFRLVGGAEMGNWGGEVVWQHSSWRTMWVRQRLADWAFPHLHAGKLGGTNAEQQRAHNPGFQHLGKKPLNLWL